MASVVITQLLRRRAADWAADPDGPRGYLAGEPDPEGDELAGIVSVNSVPASRWVEWWHQITPASTPDVLVDAVFSAPDGTYQIPDLPAGEYYRLICIDHEGVWESQIAEGRQPYVPED